MRRKRPAGTPPEALMTLKDVAAYLQVAERTVYVWAQKNTIPSFKLGDVWRFRRDDLDAWFEEQRKKTPRAASKD